MTTVRGGYFENILNFSNIVDQANFLNEEEKYIKIMKEIDKNERRNEKNQRVNKN